MTADAGRRSAEGTTAANTTERNARMPDTATPVLDVRGLRKTYAATGETAIDGLDLLVRPGEFVTVVGPSGCGKTTLLRSLTGLSDITDGTISVHGSPVLGRPPEDVALVFQDYARSLLPWLTVRKNVELPLRYRDLSKAERDQRASQAFESVGLAHAMDRHPRELSGGMQQRAAIARALAFRPALLLMDEPFAAVDAQTRSDLEDLVLRVWSESDLAVVFITHDVDEAVYLGDRVVVLNPSPTSVRDVVDVALPRPRDQVGTKELPQFAQLRSQVLRGIRRPA